MTDVNIEVPKGDPSDKVIIIHGGSLNLRIGTNENSTPKTLPHVIARKNRSKNHLVACQEDPYLIPVVKLDKECSKHIQESQSSLTTILTSVCHSRGCPRQMYPKEKLFEMNKKFKAQVLSKRQVAPRLWTPLEDRPQVIIGDDVLLLKPTEPYHIKWPMRRGRLNVHSGFGASLTSVLNDLETIWGWAIHNLLDIPLDKLKEYKVVLIIPDVYNRHHVKEIIGMLLFNMGFNKCFVHHESVCATFGAGLASATVVDVGDQKTSICCVEDGTSPRCARLTLDYGGSDITQYFHYLLKQRGFPYSELKSESRVGGMLLHKLKLDFCSLDLKNTGLRERSFQVSIPEQPVLQYNLTLSDECLFAPLAVFQPDLFLVTGSNKKVWILNRNEGDAEDPFDENYIMATKRKYGETADSSAELNVNDENEDLSICDDGSNEKEISTSKLLPLDQAIIQCIDRCPDEEVKRRVSSTILLVGGGWAFPESDMWLQMRLKGPLNALYDTQNVEVISHPKDQDPQIVTWRGAAIMSLLDAGHDMWFDAEDWRRSSVKILREKTAFKW